MNHINKIQDTKKYLETMKKSIENMENLSLEELKSYMNIVLHHKNGLYPELISLINKSLNCINKVLNENE